MTIAAGFVCNDGLVLCADTEVSLSSFKISGVKAYIAPDGPVKAGIVGAGWTDGITWFRDRLADSIDHVSNIPQAQALIEDLLAEIYRKHIYPDPHGHRNDFEMLIGLWTDGHTRLLKTAKTAVIQVSYFEALGTGWELASYFLDRMYSPTQSTWTGIALATHMLMHVKKHVQGCGGESHIIHLKNNGHCDFVTTPQIEDTERFLVAFDKAIRPVLFAGPDLNVDQEAFGRLIADAAQRLETLRSNRFIQVQQLVKEGREKEAQKQLDQQKPGFGKTE